MQYPEKPVFIEALQKQFVKTWRRIGLVVVGASLLTLAGCVVTPAESVIYEDSDSYRRSDPDVVIIDRRPAIVPGFGYRDGRRYPNRYRSDRRDSFRDRDRGPTRFDGRKPRRDDRARSPSRTPERPAPRAQKPVIPDKAKRKPEARTPARSDRRQEYRRRDSGPQGEGG